MMCPLKITLFFRNCDSKMGNRSGLQDNLLHKIQMEHLQPLLQLSCKFS